MLLVAQPGLGDDEKAALTEVIDSGWITMGPRVRAFETAFAEAHGVADAVATSSCTASLHLALLALGIGPGDEVLVPALTFVASANAVAYCGATPVFVDIEAIDVPLMSLSDAARKCTPRTKAVMVVHYAGSLCDAEAWRAFADSRNLRLVEDSAHALGAGRVGLFGDAAAFSFYGNKNMTTAEGGMVVARDPAVLERVRQLRAHGMTHGTFERLIARSSSYDVTALGFNYRMDELRAAIGLVQLKRLEEWNAKREALSQTYRQCFAVWCPEVVLPFSRWAKPGCHILPAVLPADADRLQVARALTDAEIQTSMHYPPVHLLSWYREQFPAVRLPVTEDFAARELTLPLHPAMETADVERVARTLGRCLQRARAA